MPKHFGGIGWTALALCLGFAMPAALAGGTVLTAHATLNAVPACDSNCTATITVSATTIGSTSAATALLVSTDGGVTFSNIANVAPTDWLGSGRFKTSPEQSITVSGLLGNGVSTMVTVCFMQPGANGNPLKKDCQDLTIAPPPTSNCDPNGCIGPPVDQ